jgi:hypothetical protein
MYEKKPADKLNSFRSMADMIRLFKLPYWIMLGGLFIASIFLIIIGLQSPQSPFIWIPIIIIVLVYIVSQIPREKYLYKDSARSDEVSEKMKNYEQYICDVWNILHKHGINTPEKLNTLKIECEKTLKIREEKFDKINSKLSEMLIGVPLGALIASIIYAGSDAIPVTIGAIVLIGIIVLGVIKLIKSINYYSEGYFKDKYLLDAINELIYSEKDMYSHIHQ